MFSSSEQCVNHLIRMGFWSVAANVQALNLTSLQKCQKDFLAQMNVASTQLFPYFNRKKQLERFISSKREMFFLSEYEKVFIFLLCGGV